MPNSPDFLKNLKPEDLEVFGAPNLVYVREVPAAEVLAETPLPGAEPEDGAIWYAVHAADGERLAVLDDREAAFAAAIGHDLKPVSVH